MVQWLSRWDQWLLYVLLALYGLGSLFNETPGMVGAPRWASLPIYLLFVVGPALQITGTVTNRLLTYIFGTVLTGLALLLLGATVVALSGSPGAFLTLALAAVLVMRLKRLSRNRNSLLAAGD